MTGILDATEAVTSFAWDVAWPDLDQQTQDDLWQVSQILSPRLNLPYTAHFKQLQCHLHPARGPAEPVLFGGGMGGSKSTTLCGQAVKISREIPDSVSFLGRFTFTAFRRTTLRTLRRYARAPEYHENKSEHTFTHRDTGGVIEYGQLGSEDDIINLGSAEYTFAGVDEAPQVPRGVFEMLQTRIRQIEGARADALGIWLTANPTPGWIQQDFVKKPLPGYIFIKALLSDNPFADPGYAEAMRKAMPEERYKAWILGDWDAFIPSLAVIPADLLRLAFEREEEPDWDDVAWGIDPGHLGEDDTAVWSRAGVVFRRVDKWLKLRTDETVDRLIGLYWGLPERERPWQMNVDIDGLGAGVEDQLLRAQREKKLPASPTLVVIGVHNNSRAFAAQEVSNPVRFGNVKTEDFFGFRSLLESGRGQVQDDPDLFGDLTTANYDIVNGRLLLESKDVTRKMLGRSPNDGDALILSYHRGRADEIAGRSRKPRVEMGAEERARLERQRLIQQQEEQTRLAIARLTGQQLPRTKARGRARRNLPDY